MPTPGALPKEGPKHGRTPTVHEWTEVSDRPYRGKKPKLPETRVYLGAFGDTHRIKLCTATKAWWKAISSMPHCGLWTDGDWQFALATAIVADCLFQGDRVAAQELRVREKVMGTTHDARRALRIRYVDPNATNDTGPAPPGSKVTSIDDGRRRRIERGA